MSIDKKKKINVSEPFEIVGSLASLYPLPICAHFDNTIDFSQFFYAQLNSGL